MVDGTTELASLGLDDVKSLMAQLQSRLNAAKIAYLNSTPLDGQPVSYEDVAAIAKQVIRVNYRLQEIQFGKVRLKLSVAKLIRRGR
jgi:hypothetical protein